MWEFPRQRGGGVSITFRGCWIAESEVSLIHPEKLQSRCISSRAERCTTYRFFGQRSGVLVMCFFFFFVSLLTVFGKSFVEPSSALLRATGPYVGQGSPLVLKGGSAVLPTHSAGSEVICDRRMVCPMAFFFIFPNVSMGSSPNGHVK